MRDSPASLTIARIQHPHIVGRRDIQVIVHFNDGALDRDAAASSEFAGPFTTDNQVGSATPGRSAIAFDT